MIKWLQLLVLLQLLFLRLFADACVLAMNNCMRSNRYGFGWRLRLLPPVEAFGVADVVGANGPSFTSAAVVGFAAQLLNAVSLSHFRSPPALARTEIDPNPLGSQPITRMVWVSPRCPLLRFEFSLAVIAGEHARTTTYWVLCLHGCVPCVPPVNHVVL